jgi:uncharacterized membrane protein YkoI
MRTKLLIASAAALAAIAGGVAVASGSGDDEDDRPATGAALKRASAAALAHTGGGRVTDSEAGDEEGAYEIEVTLSNGSQVDVHLDERFQVLDDEADTDTEDGAED